MIKIYRKTVTIKAEQFDGSQKMIKKYGIEDSAESGYNDSDWEDEGLCIPTKEGCLRINNGDWVATGIEGEHWPIADDVFRKTYAELPVIPKAVADWIEECKDKSISIGDMLCSERRPEKMRDWMALTPGTYQFDYARYQKHQELIARAWLDGYQVEAQHDTRTD
ncbi:DUF1642 domain-containing protein [Levilactobacillus suantsaii]|uniref:DUF1642 domain-containing protein n=1 Tax=Levilactobacillus suantsaii TaxID=2292255 RepID=A0A4Q0VIT9_9LACO|nr:DUF1642 domain-containing protein [Levilactobacillus suantsaii]QMU08601.1 DUF1642 domain-containing protein [Levilactobacillus suantsaii]RXI77356.1 DUF1642 domain-containing protein [Levilactobacillus suantsaii]